MIFIEPTYKPPFMCLECENHRNKNAAVAESLIRRLEGRFWNGILDSHASEQTKGRWKDWKSRRVLDSSVSSSTGISKELP